MVIPRHAGFQNFRGGIVALHVRSWRKEAMIKVSISQKCLRVIDNQRMTRVECGTKFKRRRDSVQG